MLVGGGSSICGGAPPGAAWVFTRSGGVWSQQGSRLVVTGDSFPNYEGVSVALSGDGNTALVGASNDSGDVGAVWVFTRSGGAWSQQGPKLVGTGGVGVQYQGASVALSADGNTALVGGYRDASDMGAVWVFTRSAGVWTQQGTKLVGTGSAGGSPLQGSSVALSSDGNTALVGGMNDGLGFGAAWVFTRSAGVWTQQGAKLFGTGHVHLGYQGASVALSGDGNTALVGGPLDGVAGSVWVYTRSAGVWTQQGEKIAGTGAVGTFVYQGQAVALSADGNTALVGGGGGTVLLASSRDSTAVGAVWVFTRSGGVWTQQGANLVGTGAVGGANQGYAVALSGDGKTAVVGGPGDDGQDGAVWVFAY
jgi:hypothetical protein